jgi:hypothetical protein
LSLDDFLLALGTAQVLGHCRIAQQAPHQWQIAAPPRLEPDVTHG